MILERYREVSSARLRNYIKFQVQSSASCTAKAGKVIMDDLKV